MGLPRRLRPIEFLQHRTGECLADDRQHGQSVVGDDLPQFRRVERTARKGGHSTTGHQDLQRHDARRAVHQRRPGEHPRGAVAVVEFDGGGDGGLDRGGNRLAERAIERLRALLELGVGPHDGFGIASRAAGVQEPEVITGPLDSGCRLVIRKEIVVVDSAVEQFAAADLDHQLEIRAAVADLRHTVGERDVEEKRLRIGVGEQIRQFVGQVAIVDVARHGALLERGELCLFVFEPVVEVEPDLVVVADPGGVDRGGDSGAAILKLPPGVRVEAVCSSDRAGHGVGDPFPDAGEIRHSRPPVPARSIRWRADVPRTRFPQPPAAPARPRTHV